ncbi:uncharacterized protein LOC129231194 [Uloborus diversus]|uniref:uncharacterized protein LOC129231194 n=1 Tax=Uloborus diversus TaxID=327109 RepID=UPI002409B203|nr:uncharacterized protein LOC129231194 [Uloborus diversus]
MDNLKKKRSYLKGRTTRLINILNDKINSDAITIDELEIYGSDSRDLWHELHELNTEIILAQKDTEIEANDKEYDEIASKIESLKFNSEHHLNSVKLPKIELPTFSGNFCEWLSFRDLFIATIHNNSSLSDAQRLQYLKLSIKGQASVLIQALQITNENYDKAWKLISDRYENVSEIINATLDRLFSQPNLNSESSHGLRKLLDITNQCIDTLEILKQPVYHWDTILVYFLKKKLDSETLRQFTLSLNRSEVPTFKSFREFIEKRAAALACLIHNTHGAGSFSSRTPNEKSFSSKNKIESKHIALTNTCLYCKDNSHVIYQCDKFKEMPISARKEFVMQMKICLNCLRPNHFANTCKSSKCKKCDRKHNTLLHETTHVKNEEHKSDTLVSNHYSESNLNAQNVLLPTAIINVHDKYGNAHVCKALIDCASQASFFREDCLQRLGIPRQRVSVTVAGLGSNESNKISGAAQIKISPVSDTDLTLTVDALTIPKITNNLPQNKIDDAKLKYFKHLILADKNCNQPSTIDVLLGADVLANIMLSGHIVIPGENLMAQETIFGWIILGKVGKTQSNSNRVYTHFTRCEEFEVQKLWELEEIPNKKILSPSEQACENHFHSTFTRNDEGRFIVRLPFHNDNLKLGSSREVAEKRLIQNEKSFVKKPEKMKLYREFMLEYEMLGHMELCSENDNSGEHFYLPHHAVMKSSQSSSKFRVVFDASAKSSSGASLNDKLMVGPTLQDDIATLLLRFRKHRIAMTSDIVKMYRQILIQPDDTQYQKILWRQSSDEEVKEFRLLTVTYGTASAPYLATKCLQQLAVEESEKFPHASQVVKSDFYVDDLMTGAESVEEVIQLQQEIIEMLKRGGFEIKKWSSNEELVLENIPPESRATSLPLEIRDDVKTLGVLWNPATDTFSFRWNLPPVSKFCSKRIVLSFISTIFDPSGWISPVILKFKLLIQHLWKLKLSWDENLPPDLQLEWKSLVEDLSQLKEIKVPRYILQPYSNIIELHGFCDASEKAYAAAVYIRTISMNGNINVQLVTSKTRVSPIKFVSLPRLELCGAFLLAKLVRFTSRALQLDAVKTLCWTDSTIVLGWLASHSSRWKTFVAHRVEKIHELVPEALWNHVDGKLNPADCASRGMTLEQLQNFPLWWRGPDFLYSQEDISHEPFQYIETDEIRAEEKKTVPATHVATATAEKSDILELLHKFSSLSKLKRVTAYCFRFIYNCKRSKEKRNLGLLSSQELDHALKFWIKQVQQQNFHPEIYCLKHSRTLPTKSKILSLNPFLDDDGLLRVGGRLRHANLPENQKYPVLLPKRSFFTDLLISSLHVTNLHAGPQLLQACIQREYWILSARDTIRQCIRKCMTCAKIKAQTAQQMLGDLPAARVTPTRPFLKCGVDYGGPFSIRMSKSSRAKTCKAYLCLFVCFSTRAIHCELVSDLSTNAFIAAFKRFISRRGKCSDIYSDCGTNFIGAKKELDELNALFKSPNHNEKIAHYLSDEGINWHFNPPAAPHMGGIWEAGIKSVKFHLKRIISNVILTYEELYTIIVQVEACLNSRPLSPLSSDPNDLSVLTPGHFLIGGPLNAVPETDFTSSKLNHLTRWQLTQRLLQHFWKRWSSEYVTRLQQRPKWFSRKPNLKVGDLVLVKNENLPPLKWRLGRISEVFPGKDGCVRVAAVKTSDGLLKRPIVKLCKLPMDSD